MMAGDNRSSGGGVGPSKIWSKIVGSVSCEVMRQFRETGVVADGGEGGVDARPRGENLCLEGVGRSRVVTGQVGGEEGAPCMRT